MIAMCECYSSLLAPKPLNRHAVNGRLKYSFFPIRAMEWNSNPLRQALWMSAMLYFRSVLMKHLVN